MRRRSALSSIVVGMSCVAAAVLASACSDDGGARDPAYSKPAFCDAAQEVAVPVQGTAASTGTLDERLREISLRAAGWRSLQSFAPKQLADEFATITSAEVATVQSLADINPTTLDELNVALSSIARMLDDRFPDRGKALDTVNAFTLPECGISVTEG